MKGEIAKYCQIYWGGAIFDIKGTICFKKIGILDARNF